MRIPSHSCGEPNKRLTRFGVFLPLLDLDGRLEFKRNPAFFPCPLNENNNRAIAG
jgi:hypothetical protein